MLKSRGLGGFACGSGGGWCWRLCSRLRMEGRGTARSSGARGRPRSARRLVADGVPLDEASGLNGWTPLMHAAHAGTLAAAQACLRRAPTPTALRAIARHCWSPRRKAMPRWSRCCSTPALTPFSAAPTASTCWRRHCWPASRTDRRPASAASSRARIARAGPRLELPQGFTASFRPRSPTPRLRRDAAPRTRVGELIRGVRVSPAPDSGARTRGTCAAPSCGKLLEHGRDCVSMSSSAKNSSYASRCTARRTTSARPARAEGACARSPGRSRFAMRCGECGTRGGR